MDRLDGELDNLRAALSWCVERGKTGDDAALDEGLWVAGTLHPYWLMRAHYAEGAAWLARLLGAAAKPIWTAGRARALQTASVSAATSGQRVSAHALAAESLAICQTLDDQAERARALMVHGSMQTTWPVPGVSDPAAGRARLEEALTLYREAGDYWGMETTLLHLGLASLGRGDLARAETALRDSLECGRRLGDRWTSSMALNALAGVTMARGNVAAARALLEQEVQFAGELRDKQTVASALNLLGQLTQDSGDTAAARAYFTRTLAVLDETGDIALGGRGLWAIAVLAAPERWSERILGLARAALAPPRAPSPTAPDRGQPLDALDPAAAQTMTLQQVVAAALADLP